MITVFETGKYTGAMDNITYHPDIEGDEDDDLWLMAVANLDKPSGFPALETSTPSRKSLNKKKGAATSNQASAKKDIDNAHKQFLDVRFINAI